MATTAFPVRQDTDGNGCTDVTLRKIMQALHPTKGIITGLTVSVQNSLNYYVGAGTAVCSKGSSDGNTLAYWAGGTVSTTSNTSSNPRIDVIWITSHDITQGDSNNYVTLGVTQGTAAASPTAPSIPSYATKIVAMKVPASATTTSSASVYGSYNRITAVTTMGLLASSTIANSATGDATKLKWYTENSTSFYVPTKRLVELQYDVSVRCSETSGTDTYIGWGLKCFNLDGKAIANSTWEWRVEPYITEHRKASVLVEVSAGSHTCSVTTGKMAGNDTSRPQFAYGNPGDSSGRSYCGRVLKVWDRGYVD